MLLCNCYLLLGQILWVLTLTQLTTLYLYIIHDYNNLSTVIYFTASLIMLVSDYYILDRDVLPGFDVTDTYIPAGLVESRDTLGLEYQHYCYNLQQQ